MCCDAASSCRVSRLAFGVCDDAAVSVRCWCVVFVKEGQKKMAYYMHIVC